VTTFELDIPPHLDVPISFVFDGGNNNQPYRAFMFVNGWHMGKVWLLSVLVWYG
jgi:Beta-galactosidase jelly roll domain